VITESDIKRFHEKYQPIPFSGCWIWDGALFADGRYGQFHVKHKPYVKNFLAHRASWLIHRGPIPDGLCVCHRCDVTMCVNPDHLFLATIDGNNKDRAAKGRSFRPRGEKKTTAKLTDERVAYLRSLPILRVKHATALAAEWGVSFMHLYRVRRGDRWLSL
jgi:hypothetical protein